MLKRYTNHSTLDLHRVLAARTDSRGLRMQHLLSLPDLSRTRGTPVYHVTQSVLDAPALAEFDTVEFPEIISVERNFDDLCMPKDHPGRRHSDTYYVNDTHVLRTQTTTMWPFYLRDPDVRTRLDTAGDIGAVAYGKVYRNDDIDRYHYPVFHQIDGLRLCNRDIREFTTEDLVNVLVDIAKKVFGDTVRWRVGPDTFPFTNPSIELLIDCSGEWVEVLGAGLVNPAVLEKVGLDKTRYNGWAFGFGLDRLAMLRMQIPDIRILWSPDPRIARQFTGLDNVYAPVSVYPPVDRDVSFLLADSQPFLLAIDIIREYGRVDNEDLIEEVSVVDRYANAEKLGAGTTSHTIRIRYRSHLRTLTGNEINAVQERVRRALVSELGARLR